MRVCGVDFSSHFVDLVTVPFDDGPPEWTRVPLDRKGHRLPSFSAAREMRRALGRKALLGGWWDDVSVAYLERPYGRGQSIHALMRIQGAFVACIPRHVIVDELAPGEWRGLVGLKGNASKDDVRAWVGEQWLAERLPRSVYEWPQDGVDAYCIAVAGRNLCQSVEKAA